jgi:glycosyltransferase involved in cell wall biosynthesis
MDKNHRFFNKKMRIAIVTHNIIKGDGQGRVNYEIAQYALSQGNKVFLITNQVDKDLIQKGAVWMPIKIPKFPILLKVLLFAYKANRMLNKIKVDVIYGAGFTLTKKHDVNTAHFIHDAWMKSPMHTSKIRKGPYGWYQWIYTKLNMYFEKISFKKSKMVVAVSKKIKQDLTKIGIHKEKIHVIYNGVDINEFFPGKTNRKNLKLPEKVPLALFVGDIKTPRKNLDTVLKALVKIPELHLAVAGDTRESPYIKLAKELKLTKRVHFLGYKKDVANIMHAVDLFVFPSRYDPFAIVVLEAMASSLPVITTKTVGASELITPKSGIVLKYPNETKALAQAMNDLVKNPKKRKETGKVGRVIAKRYTWDIIAKQYMDLFKKINK